MMCGNTQNNENNDGNNVVVTCVSDLISQFLEPELHNPKDFKDETKRNDNISLTDALVKLFDSLRTLKYRQFVVKDMTGCHNHENGLLKLVSL